MEEGTDQPVRKRKSNFDVLPANLDVPIISSDGVVDRAALAEKARKILDNADNNAALTKWEPVTTPAFQEKLKTALEKNLDYITRKDNNTLVVKSKDPASKANSKVSAKYEAKRNAFIPKRKTGIGAGSAQPNASTQPSASTQSSAQPPSSDCPSVYIGGLPKDITDEELGKIKKIKIYTNADGQKKGDALLTYFRAESARNACRHFHGIDIGDGCVISVELAEFGSKTSSASTAKKKTDKHDVKTNDMMSVALHAQDLEVQPSIPHTVNTNIADEKPVEPRSLSDESELRKALPIECEVHKYPVVLIWEAYDPAVNNEMMLQSDPNFFIDLEADMLVECCKFGKVLRLCSPESDLLHGCIAVTYESTADAKNCATSLNGRWFDFRQLQLQVLAPPPPPLPPILLQSLKSKAEPEATVESKNKFECLGLLEGYEDTSQDHVSTTKNTLSEVVNDNHVSAAEIAAAEEDIENFLNSLL